jgi:hypothetical protein
MKFASLIAVTILSALFCSAAHAEKKILKWTDEKGVVHYGNSQPGAATGLGAQTMNAQGVVTNTQVDQSKALSAAEEKKRQEELKRKAEAQKIEDQRLLDSYATEEDLTRSYQQNVELLDQQMKATQVDIESRQKGLNKLIATAGESERAGKPVPEQIKILIVNERAQIETQRKYIAAKQAARLTAKTEYDTNVARYREVVARNKK